jgi:uncharacterized RDD family membrane protein YckC
MPSLDDSGRSRPSSNKSSSSVSSSGEPIAALGDRLIAVLLDTAFLGALFFILIQFVSRRPDLVQSWLPSAAWVTASGISLGLLIAFLYYWTLEGLFGATLGKAIAGVQVRPIGGAGRIGFRASLWRNLLRFVDGIAFYFLGYLVALFSRQNRRIGDYVAGTVVVQRKMAWGEKVTVVLLWMVGVAAFSWAAYTVCPRCVDLQVERVVEQLGFRTQAHEPPRLAAN